MERETDINRVDMETWRSLREQLLRFVLSRGVEGDAAEDVVHDVLIKALEPGSGPDDPSRLLPWLYQVTRNAIADRWRKQRPTEELPEDLAAPAAGIPDPVPEELVGCLDLFLARLDADERTALEAADRDGLPQADVASRLGLSVSGAKSRIQRSRAKIREMYVACCSVELDRRGGVADYQMGDCDCSPDGGRS